MACKQIWHEGDCRKIDEALKREEKVQCEDLACVLWCGFVTLWDELEGTKACGIS